MKLQHSLSQLSATLILVACATPFPAAAQQTIEAKIIATVRSGVFL